jgi:hypothetical protein
LKRKVIVHMMAAVLKDCRMTSLSRCSVFLTCFIYILLCSQHGNTGEALHHRPLARPAAGDVPNGVYNTSSKFAHMLQYWSDNVTAVRVGKHHAYLVKNETKVLFPDRSGITLTRSALRCPPGSRSCLLSVLI